MRSTFIIDPDGVLSCSCLHDDNSTRNTDEMPRALPAPQTGEPCPVDWPSGKVSL